MDRRSSSLGCVVAALGALLSCCLLPYLISSAYSVASVLFQQPAATRWLWGDWLSTLANPRSDQYRLLVELPICCVGILGVLVTVLGLVWAIGGRDQEEGTAEDEFEAEVSPEEEAAFPPYLEDELDEQDSSPLT